MNNILRKNNALSREDNFQLLQRYEPILEFQGEESFFPSSVHSFIRSSDLWEKRKGTNAHVVKNGEQLIEENFKPDHQPFEGIFYLSAAQKFHLNQNQIHQEIKKLREAKKKQPHHRHSKTASVFRFLLKLSLPLRKFCPPEVYLTRRLLYETEMKVNETYYYYGRVINQLNTKVLQYWYFYVYNNWRSGYGGINDHEGDWECVTVYLQTASSGEFIPYGVACSRHTLKGPVIFRAWDSEDISRVESHPRIFVSGGSHANFFYPGQHGYRVTLPGIQANLPFIDYTDCEGIKVGYQCDRQWTPVLLDPLPEWVENYQGYWGMHVGDPFHGENGIPGPMYNPDHSQRASWIDPVGWAGIKKTSL